MSDGTVWQEGGLAAFAPLQFRVHVVVLSTLLLPARYVLPRVCSDEPVL